MHCWEHRCTTGVCWGRCRHFSRNYKAQRASGWKYEARITIFCILAAVDRFSRISWKVEPLRKIGMPLRKAESHWGKQKAVDKNRKADEENWILCEENWILGEGSLDIGEGNLNIGEGNLNISKRFSSIWQFWRLVFPTQLVACVRKDFSCWTQVLTT